MPTDLQIIDGFDALRAAFLEENAPVAERILAAVPEPVAPGTPVSSGDALEAWLTAMLGWEPPVPPARRRSLRGWREALLGGPGGQRSGSLEGLPARVRGARDFHAIVRKNAAAISLMADELGTCRHRPHPTHLTGEARAWSSILSGLHGARPWVMLAALGRTVPPVDAAAARFLWRMGLLDAKRPARAGTVALVSRMEELTRLVALRPAELKLMIRWHTARVPGLTGGGLCGSEPACGNCPMNAWCALGKFRPKTDPSRDYAEADAAPAADPADLRRRLETEGPEALGDAELIALLIPAAGGEAAAEKLLRRYRGLPELDRASIRELAAFGGMGPAGAARLKAGLELGRRLAAQPLRQGEAISGSEEVWRAFGGRYRNLAQEHFVILLLDTKNRLIQTCIVSKGTLDGSPAHPREIFREAVRHSASAVILIHNHPSGDPAPSPEDFAVTRRVSEAGRIVGVRVLDHIILGHDRYYSFKDEEKM